MYPEKIAALLIALWMAFIIAYNVYMVRRPNDLKEEQGEKPSSADFLNHMIVYAVGWVVCFSGLDWVFSLVFGWKRTYRSVWAYALAGALYGFLVSLFHWNQRKKKPDKSTSVNDIGE